MVLVGHDRVRIMGIRPLHRRKELQRPILPLKPITVRSMKKYFNVLDIHKVSQCQGGNQFVDPFNSFQKRCPRGHLLSRDCEDCPRCREYEELKKYNPHHKKLEDRIGQRIDSQRPKIVSKCCNSTVSVKDGSFICSKCKNICDAKNDK